MRQKQHSSSLPRSLRPNGTDKVTSMASVREDHIEIGGAKIYAGAGVPASGLGANGDFYLRTDGTLLTSTLYKKVAGAWVGISAI